MTFTLIDLSNRQNDVNFVAVDCVRSQDILTMPPEYQLVEEVTLAHELGHMLSLDHETDPKNLMTPEAYNGPGRLVTKEQFKKILDYEKAIAPSSFYVVEE